MVEKPKPTSSLAEKELEGVAKAVEGTKTKVLALTVLSHYDDSYCAKWFHKNMRMMVMMTIDMAALYGCHGVIMPGMMLDTATWPELIKVATGIRPSWYKDDRHEHVITPAEAKKNGADMIVVGSPIMNAGDPVEALRKILDEIKE